MSLSVLEVEKKAHLTDFQAVKERLTQLENVEHRGISVKNDLYFTPAPILEYGELKKQSFIFRVRILKQDHILTLKYKTLSGNTEINEEIEIKVHHSQEKEITDFFLKLENPMKKEDWEMLWKCKTQQDWILFLEKKGFFFLLHKEKETELYTTLIEEKRVSIELNKLDGLGNFIEIEILCSDRSSVQHAVNIINNLFVELKIDPSLEEPRLYLELLFLNRRKISE